VYNLAAYIMSLPPQPPTNQDVSPLDRQNVVALEVEPPSQARRILLETIETIALALVLFLAINFVSARIRVDGNSMEPNFHNGDYVVVNRLAFRAGEITRGDVVVFPYPKNPEVDYIKRVIGLPGDRVAIYNGSVYVNGSTIEEPYLLEAPYGNYAEHIVPEGEVFVLGDNRNNSEDSRSWGFLDIDQIIGKAVFRYWPFDTAGLVYHPVLVVAPQ
jgi:signal peptidase I